MGVWQAIKSALSFPAYGGQGRYSGGIADWMTWRGDQAYDYREAAGPLHQNGVVMSCAAWIMRAFPEAVLQVVGEDAQGEENEVVKHPLTVALQKPNPFYGADCLWQRLMFDRSLHGQAYLYKMRGSGGNIVSLWHVPQHRIIPQWDTSGKQFISHYLFVLEQRNEKIPIEDLVHFRFGGDPYHERNGLASLGAGLREIGALNEGANYRGAILRNMGVPSHVLQGKDPAHPVTKEQAAALHQLWAERVSGTSRGKPIIPNFAMEAIKIGMSPAELDLGTMNYENVDLICSLFGLSAMVINLSSGSAHKTYCLPAGARIWTTAGARRIVDLKPGEMVWSMVDGCLQPRRILRRWMSGRREIFELRTRNRRLRASANHPILVRRPGSLSGGNNEARRVGLAWRSLGLLQPGDRVVEPRYVPDQEGGTLPDGREATAAMMQFLGAYVGDGCTAREQAVIMAMPAGDRAGLVYRGLARELFTKRGGEAVAVAEQARSFGFCSVAAVKQLKAWGFGGTAKTKRIPGWVYGLSRGLRLSFLAGLVDSDGTIDKRGCLSFSFANEALAEDVRDLLIGCGIQCCNIAHVTLPADCLPNPGRRLFYDSWRFTASSADEVADIPFCDPLYRRRVDSNQGRRRRAGFDAKKTGLGDELGFYTIRSIQSVGFEDVYDIEVEGGHSFIADGVVVHNSNYAEARQAAVETCLVPMWKQIAQDLTLQLLPDYSTDDSECVEFCTDNVRALQEDQSAVWDRVINAYKAEIIDRYRAVQGLGLNPEEDDKGVYYQQAGGLNAVGAAPLPGQLPTNGNGAAGNGQKPGGLDLAGLLAPAGHPAGGGNGAKA